MGATIVADLLVVFLVLAEEPPFYVFFLSDLLPSWCTFLIMLHEVDGVLSHFGSFHAGFLWDLFENCLEGEVLPGG